MKLKKIFLAACAATMVLAGATVASAAAPQLKVDYNEDLSTANTAVVEVYYVNSEDAAFDFDSEQFKSLNITLALMDGTTAVSKNYFSSATVEQSLAGGSTANCMLNATNKNIMCVGAGGGDIYGYLNWDAETGHIATFTIALAKEIDKELTLKATAARYQRTSDSSNKTATTLSIDTVKPVQSEPTVNTVAATSVALAAPGENEVAGEDVAAAYKAGYTFTGTETAAAWTADGKADLPISIANLSGPVDFGLIVTGGTVNNVALKVTTPAN